MPASVLLLCSKLFIEQEEKKISVLKFNCGRKNIIINNIFVDKINKNILFYSHSACIKICSEPINGHTQKYMFTPDRKVKLNKNDLKYSAFFPSCICFSSIILSSLYMYMFAFQKINPGLADRNIYYKPFYLLFVQRKISSIYFIYHHDIYFIFQI